MAEVLVSKQIEVPAEKAWGKLSYFGGMEEYSPVEICTLVGSGVGATRICYLPNGSTIYEVLERLENDRMELEYKITVGPFPITGYVSQVKVEDAGEGACTITWGCEFGVKPQKKVEMETLFEGFFDTIIDELEVLIGHQES